MAKSAKRRDRYVLDYYDDQNKRQRKVLPVGTILKKAKEKLREIEDQLAKGLYISQRVRAADELQQHGATVLFPCA